MVDEIAELLNISNDSALQAHTEEKPISFDEIRILCSHFKYRLTVISFADGHRHFSGKIRQQPGFRF